jgi:hypothetical protein
MPATAGRWETLACLGVFGGLYTIGYLLVSWTWILTPHERMHLIKLRGRLLGKVPRWKSS